MTNGWTDLANSDVFLIMGANPAENHPCGFKWAIEAKRNRNARMIVVDPRFTRTAATADFHVPIRAGTDLVYRFIKQYPTWPGSRRQSSSSDEPQVRR